MKTAEQWADELVERLNGQSMHCWRSIIIAAFKDATREARAPRPTPPCGMSSHHHTCDCKGMGGDR